jgi:hypothetical protein
MKATGRLTNRVREPQLDVIEEELKRKETPSSLVEILDDDSHGCMTKHSGRCGRGLTHGPVSVT